MSCKPLTFEERLKIESGCKLNVSVNAIARSLSRTDTCVRQEIKRNGGKEKYSAQEGQLRLDQTLKNKIEKLKAFNKTRPTRVFIKDEDRFEIERLLKEGFSAQAIARQLNKPANTVIREIRVNGGRDLYCAEESIKTRKKIWDQRTKELSERVPKIITLNEKVEAIGMQLDIILEIVRKLEK